MSLRPAATLATALLTVVAACGTTTRVVPTNPSPRPLMPRTPDEVQVFTTAAPSEPFVEVAIIQSRQESKYSLDQMPEIVAAMRAEAARIGCDGVVIRGAADKVVSDGVWTGNTYYAGTNTLEGFWGACIVYTVAPEPYEPTAAAAPITAAAPNAAAGPVEQAVDDEEPPTNVP